MNVAMLHHLLGQLMAQEKGDMPVVLQRDPEGNGFSITDYACADVYIGGSPVEHIEEVWDDECDPTLCTEVLLLVPAR